MKVAGRLEYPTHVLMILLVSLYVAHDVAAMNDQLFGLRRQTGHNTHETSTHPAGSDWTAVATQFL